MSDLVLEHLKRIQADITDLKHGQRDIKTEIVAVKDIIGALIRSDARRDGDIAQIEDRIERIERRLDIAGTPS
jgi:hypothetical protein